MASLRVLPFVFVLFCIPCYCKFSIARYFRPKLDEGIMELIIEIVELVCDILFRLSQHNKYLMEEVIGNIDVLCSSLLRKWMKESSSWKLPGHGKQLNEWTRLF